MKWYTWVFVSGIVLLGIGILLIILTNLNLAISVSIIVIGLIAALVALIVWIRERSRPTVEEKGDLIKGRFQESYNSLESVIGENENRKAAFKTALVSPDPIAGAVAGGLGVSIRDKVAARAQENREKKNPSQSLEEPVPSSPMY